MRNMTELSVDLTGPGYGEIGARDLTVPEFSLVDVAQSAWGWSLVIFVVVISASMIRMISGWLVGMLLHKSLLREQGRIRRL
ncbi:hypothetical protein EJ05DRAFT_213991 [Pseudovirgaria hyperparasitica]|uniref:Uncharacterized protein n=1 Tax=Pseudovirgaria hyperparasitica TaxID=470096 RepID=A0A6A6VVY3_9PEZI|nr:uncharacterized protein EJ05DRAFT_213991 [Pseudovirgaria hyperparasitica]KAF2753407.1 hypothetical protein EJ05DRAFT_213991 [Pseudovirgaria hyperparasitica]